MYVAVTTHYFITVSPKASQNAGTPGVMAVIPNQLSASAGYG